MLKNISELGPKEARFVSLSAAKDGGFFTLDEAIQFWGSRKMAWNILSRLQKKGWIERIERGKYFVIPLEAGPSREWSENPYLVASALVHPCAIAYWSAIRHWNWTEQIPRIMYLQTTRRKSRPRRTICGVEYEIVTVSKRKFFGHAKQWHAGKAFLVTDKEKTLIDCADDVERSGSIEELAKAVVHAAKEISWEKLDRYADQFPNATVKKRLGYLFETLVSDLPQEAQDVLPKWQGELAAGISPLLTKGGTKGKISTRWRIRINAGI